MRIHCFKASLHIYNSNYTYKTMSYEVRCYDRRTKNIVPPKAKMKAKTDY